MKIAFAGAQGTGKTTLVRALQNDPLFKDAEFATDITKRARELNMGISREGDDALQYLILQAHRDITSLESFVSDRSILDCFTYGLYQFTIGKLSPDTMVECYRTLYELLPKYDYIFYLKPEFPLEANGIRDTDEMFRDNIVTLFEQVQNQLSPNLRKRIYTLTGNVDSRLAQIKEVING